jgi:[ribosomal protein S5]-alanine N-acetyltransferase
MDLPPLHIETERLRLVAGTKRLVRADRAKLASLLKADVTLSWPPAPLADAIPIWAERLSADPDLTGWLHWYVVLKDEQGEEDVLIGSAGFNGLEDESGTLLMGYCILPAFQCNGYATEAALGLLGWAFDRPGVRRVAARTFPEHMASVRVLEHIGMRPVHDPSDPYYEAVDGDAGAVLFEITRTGWEQEDEQP